MNIARDLIAKIITTLCGRRGFSNWWYDIDDEIQEEIIAELSNIIVGAIFDGNRG